MSDLLTRPRRDEDLSTLAEILIRQQPETQYPFHWPSEGGPVAFLRRPSELEAWVAEVDGAVAGHVAIQSVADDDELGEMWASAHGVPITQLRCISVLFSDRRLARRGIGSALLALATERVLAADGAPVLDVVAEHRDARRLYGRRGWVEVGRSRPVWLPSDAEPVYVLILPRSSEQR